MSLLPRLELHHRSIIGLFYPFRPPINRIFNHLFFWKTNKTYSVGIREITLAVVVISVPTELAFGSGSQILIHATVKIFFGNNFLSWKLYCLNLMKEKTMPCSTSWCNLYKELHLTSGSVFLLLTFAGCVCVLFNFEARYLICFRFKL